MSRKGKWLKVSVEGESTAWEQSGVVQDQYE
jgi:hypothetical protein